MSLNDKVKARMKERQKLCGEIAKSIDELAKRIGQLVQSDLETYQLLVKPDCLFNDSPISAMQTYRAIKDHMIKRDMDFIGYAINGKLSLKDLSQWADEIPGWVLRFTSEPKPEKKGLESII